MVLTWHKGVIPYEFDDDLDIPRNMIQAAMKEIELNTQCIKFRPLCNDLNQYILITKGTRCSSDVGRRFRFHEEKSNRDISYEDKDVLMQEMYVDTNNYNMGILLHELCHVIGLYHEHQQPRRDDYLQIHFSNILEEQRIHFVKYNAEEISLCDAERIFDYDSIMLYGEKTFAKDDKISISPKNKGRHLRAIEVKRLSWRDIKKIQHLYSKFSFTK